MTPTSRSTGGTFATNACAQQFRTINSEATYVLYRPQGLAFRSGNFNRDIQTSNTQHEFTDLHIPQPFPEVCSAHALFSRRITPQFEASILGPMDLGETVKRDKRDIF